MERNPAYIRGVNTHGHQSYPVCVKHQVLGLPDREAWGFTHLPHPDGFCLGCGRPVRLVGVMESEKLEHPG